MKISIKEINKNKFNIIPKNIISEINKRIKLEMEPIIKENNRKLIQSELDIKNKIKNENNINNRK